jgi:fucose 4-O-acetylase-like acetyltransferase
MAMGRSTTRSHGGLLDITRGVPLSIGDVGWSTAMIPCKPEARSGGEPKVEFVYTIRGYALLWVVLDHAVAFTEGSFDLVVGPGNRSLYNVVDDMTEGTRLPILMFLAALFVERGFNAGARSFITKRMQYLVWPWLLWTLVTILVLATANKLGDELSTAQFDDLLSMWWKPQYQTWFLYDLIVYNVVYLAARAVDRRLVLAVAVALFAASFWLGDMQMSSLVGKGIRHYGRFFLFYWLGIMLSRWVLSRRVEQERLLLVACLAAFLLLAVPPVLMDTARWHTTAIASALPALPLMLWLGPRLAATPLCAPLGWVGRASLLILCLHLIPVWALVVGTRRLGIDDPTLVALLSTIGAIAFCYGIDRLTQSTGVSPLLGFALRAQRTAVRPAKTSTAAAHR